VESESILFVIRTLEARREVVNVALRNWSFGCIGLTVFLFIALAIRQGEPRDFLTLVGGVFLLGWADG
jgi:hypothetical protein